MARHVDVQQPVVYFDTIEEAEYYADSMNKLIGRKGYIELKDYFNILEVDLDLPDDIKNVRGIEVMVHPLYYKHGFGISMLLDIDFYSIKEEISC